MKKQEFKQLKERGVVELQKELKDYQIKLRDLKLDLAAGKVKNIRSIKDIKKTIARIMTLINAKKS